MRKIVLAVALFSLGITSCSYDSINSNSLNGTWTVLSFTNLVTNVTEFKTQENSWNMAIKVTFDDSKKTISGTNISNELFGEFNYVGTQQFRVTNLGSTYVYQPRWANEFLRVLTDGDLPFRITNGNLVIYYQNKSKSVTLTIG